MVIFWRYSWNGKPLKERESKLKRQLCTVQASHEICTKRNYDETETKCYNDFVTSSLSNVRSLTSEPIWTLIYFKRDSNACSGVLEDIYSYSNHCFNGQFGYNHLNSAASPLLNTGTFLDLNSGKNSFKDCSEGLKDFSMRS